MEIPKLKLVTQQGKSKVVHITDVKYILPVDMATVKLPDYPLFGRQSQSRQDCKCIPNIKWNPTTTINVNFTSVTSKLNSSVM